MAKGQIHEKISLCVEEMICNSKLQYQFYGEFTNYMNFIPNKNMSTAGVNVGKRGMQFYYNPDFIDSRTQKEINFLTLHEILHLMYEHPKRTKEHHDHYLANIAQDMIINDILRDDFNKDFHTEIEGCQHTPPSYNGKLYFEDIYEYIAEQNLDYEVEKSKHGQNGNGDSEGQGNGKGDSEGQGNGKGDSEGQGNGKGQGKPKDGRPGKNGKYSDGYTSKIDESLRDIFDNHSDNPDGVQTVDTHMQNDIDDDIAKEIVNDVTQGLKARGLATGNVETVLGKLKKTRKDHLKAIKRSVDTMKGVQKWKTIARPNMLGIDGLKGKKKTGHGINCIVDTSGSMMGDFEKTLAYIFQRGIQINLIQCDTQVQSFTTITSLKQFDSLVIKGLGGTVLMPGVNYIKEHKNLRTFNTVILTDGYTDTLDFTGYNKKVLIISSGTECPVHDTYRKVKQIVIGNDNI